MPGFHSQHASVFPSLAVKRTNNRNQDQAVILERNVVA